MVRTMNQPFNELDKARCAHASSDYHESEFTLGTHSRDHIQSKTSPGTAHNRRLSLDCPCSARMMVRSNASLISKEYLRLFCACQAPNPRVPLLQPALNFFRLLLIGTPNRTLRGQSQLRQQPAHRRFAQFYVKTIIDHLPDHFCRPQGIGEPHLKRVLHRLGAENPLHGRAIQLRRSSAPLTSIQRTPSAVTVSCQPTVHGCTGDTHCLGHNFWTMAFLNASYSPLSYRCQILMVKFSRISLFHAQYYTILA